MVLILYLICGSKFVENTKSKIKKKGGNKGYKDHQFSSKTKDFVVRIAHPCGQLDVYGHLVPAYSLTTKYQDMCIASPNDFKLPHQSVLWREDLLNPCHKYILISERCWESQKKVSREG